MDQDLAQPAPDAITERLRWILRGLRSVLGMWGLDNAVAGLAYRRCGEIFGRIERMLARFRAGTLRLGTQRSPRQTPYAHRAARAAGLPRRFGWLVLAGKHQAAGYGSQLQHLLAEPDMAAMLEVAPQARRVLRPLLRALAVELPWTVTSPPPPRPRKPRPPRQTPEPFRIPLPRGVITWARQEMALENARQRLRAIASESFRFVFDK